MLRRRREPAHVVTDHKECGGHTLGLKCVEDAVGGLGVWAVVEGEIQPPSGAGATPDRPAEQRCVGVIHARGEYSHGREPGRHEQGAHRITRS